ncbi:MAG: chromosomal replication initiator DnaA [Robiginitomaculum sp.]|nr:MAG: chromosomal replication initiator DnaA [Robiginitomaculum sp.]
MNNEYIYRRNTDEARARLTRALVCFTFNVKENDLAAATRRNAKVAFARQIAMYLAHVAFELSLSRVASAFGRDRTTVSHACHLIEDRRDDPGFDLQLEGLERVLRELPEPQWQTVG